MFVDRRNLAATLKDGKNITKTLENLIGIVIHTIFIFFYLLVWEANVGFPYPRGSRNRRTISNHGLHRPIQYHT